MKKEIFSETNLEYQEFLASDGLLPSARLSDKIISSVKRELSPNAWLIFSKMAFVHMIAGIFTLSVCPQFGVRFFGTGHGLMTYFMALGRYGCIAACGGFFIGVSILLTGLLLKKPELKKLREHELLQLSAIVFSSLGALIMADAEILLGFGAAWALGSFLGGFAMLELSWFIRQKTN